MEYTFLGKSDLKVSKICLGCMGFGDGSSLQPYALDYESSKKIIKIALDDGINFFDTANCYGNGSSEVYLGKAIKELTSRDKVIIATKVYYNEGKLSKEAILREVKGSLKRLNTDYIDLLIIHRFDYDHPIEETLETLNELIEKKKVRYIGASAMYAYQLQKMLDTQDKYGYKRFISMQDHYNLIYREEEREMFKLLKEEGLSSTPYSPLAGGRLARLWDGDTLRSKLDNVGRGKYDSTKDIDLPIVLRVKEIADKHNVPMSTVSLSYILSHDEVGSVIIGASKEKHILDAVEAVNFHLNNDEIKYLEELYVPHKVVGALDNPNR